MKLPTLENIPAEVDRWDMHRLLEAALAGLRSSPPDTLREDYEETLTEVLRLTREVEDAHPELKPSGWSQPWGSAV